MKTKKQNYNEALKLINKIQNIRKKNNVNWMDVLRLALNMIQKMQQKLCQMFTPTTKE